MAGLYTLIIVVLMLLVAYGIYAYVRLALHVEPQRKPVETSMGKSENEEFNQEITYFPEWEKKKPEPVPEIPDYYHKDSLVLMARDPYWLYAYWEITATRQQEFEQQYGQNENYQPVLRVYDVSEVINFNGTNANSYLDIDISGYVNNWYINVDGPDRKYCVDYGYRLTDGRFITILRSNFASTPRAYMSDVIDEQWKPIAELYPNNLYPGSSEEMFRQ